MDRDSAPRPPPPPPKAPNLADVLVEDRKPSEPPKPIKPKINVSLGLTSSVPQKAFPLGDLKYKNGSSSKELQEDPEFVSMMQMNDQDHERKNIPYTENGGGKKSNRSSIKKR